jgi:hypothetical protein
MYTRQKEIISSIVDGYSLLKGWLLVEAAFCDSCNYSTHYNKYDAYSHAASTWNKTKHSLTKYGKKNHPGGIC